MVQIEYGVKAKVNVVMSETVICHFSCYLMRIWKINMLVGDSTGSPGLMRCLKRPLKSGIGHCLESVPFDRVKENCLFFLKSFL